MNISHITTIDEITGFLKSTGKYRLAVQSKSEVYSWLDRLLAQMKYHKLKSKDRKIVKQFIQRITNYHVDHIKRLIRKHKNGELQWKKWQKPEFSQVYTQNDIALLHKVDSVHRLAGPSTKKILRREYEIFGKEEYRKLANISVSHIYNLRNRISYKRLGQNFTKTKPTVINIGKRKKPQPCGRPGFLRVDTVHQGDKGKSKGLYFINVVDEVTQMEFVFCAPVISQRYMKPILQTLIKLCPFIIINFHSDNGSEYINYVIAGLLNRLHIQQTKSRARKSNDNALAESKNGSVIRKHFGYTYIPATDYNAHILNAFCIHYLNPYLNYHRPCGFARTKIDAKGKEKKIYYHQDYRTPYEKFKSLKQAKKYLKSDIHFDDLEQIAYAESDTEFAEKMKEEKQKVFNKLKC